MADASDPKPAAPNAQLPTLPHTWRPRRARAFVLAIAVAVLLAVGTVAVFLPSAGGADLKMADRIGVTAVGAGIAWFLFRHASVRVTATTEGLDVVNLFRRRQVAWSEIQAVNLQRGDPWVTLDLGNDAQLAVMAIQSADGAAAPQAARALARLAARQTAGAKASGDGTT